MHNPGSYRILTLAEGVHNQVQRTLEKEKKTAVLDYSKVFFTPKYLLFKESLHSFWKFLFFNIVIPRE